MDPPLQEETPLREVESESESESEYEDTQQQQQQQQQQDINVNKLQSSSTSSSSSSSSKEVLQVEKDISKALLAKESGNEKFRSKLYDESIQLYSVAITYCPEDNENKDNLAAFYGNRAAAYIAIEEYQLAIDDCSESIKLKPDYIKVLMRRCQGQEKLGHLEEAITGNIIINYYCYCYLLFF